MSDITSINELFEDGEAGRQLKPQFVTKRFVMPIELGDKNFEFAIRDEVPTMYFERCEFFHPVIIKSKLPVYVVFKNCTFHSRFVFNVNAKAAIVSFDKVIANHSPILIVRSASKLYVKGLTFSKGGQFVINNVDHFIFDANTPPNGSICKFYFGGVVAEAFITGNFSHLTIEGHLANSSRVKITDSIAEILTIQNFRNFGYIHFNRIDSYDENGREFNAINTSMGDATFSNVHLIRFKKIFISNSSLNHSRFFSCDFPIDSLCYLEKDDKNHVSDKVDLFRQLKHVFDNQQDHLIAQKFHALELEEYRKKINREGKAKWFTDEWQTAAVIWWSKNTSGFGQSWLQPLLLLVAFHWILFIIAVGVDAIPGLKLQCPPTREGFWTGVEYYCKTINPTHRLESRQFSGGTMLINIIMRIWSAYMIYNFVRATRRFIR